MPRHFTLRATAILLLTTGYGWAGGHFIPSDAPFWAYLFQFLMLLLLTMFAIGFLRSAIGYLQSAIGPNFETPARTNKNIVALNLFAALTLIVNVVNVIRGSANTGQFGSHNSFSDLVPIGLIVIGDVLWLSAIRLKRTAETP
jgi:hypothetical protein